MTDMSDEAKEILLDIRTFVKGASAREGHKLTLEEHAHCALHLLQTVPAARPAALDFLGHVYDEGVNAHLYEAEGQANPAPHLEEVIVETHQVLKNFIDSNPQAWAPIISAWSIDLLGRISSNYSSRRGVPHSSSLDEQLQLWMSCKGTRLLMELSSHCISVMVDSCPDACVDAILDTSVKHSPHFDWVVAHIGSCFPKTIINRVLSLGLKDFCSSQSGGHLVATETKVPKMVSVVGILGHLAAQHSSEIRAALMQLFNESLGGIGEQQVYTVPFLLQLSTMSSVLLKTVTVDFIHAMSFDVLNKLADQFSKSVILQRDKDTLLMLVIHLVSKSGSGAFNLVQFLLSIGSGVHPQETSRIVRKEVQDACALILDLLILEIQRCIYSQSGSLVKKGNQKTPSEVPLLSELQKHTSSLCSEFLKASGKRVEWLQRVLAMVAVQCGELSAANILSYLLVNISQDDKLSSFLSLQAEMEVEFPSVMLQAAQKAVNQLQRTSPQQNYQILNNMVIIVKTETSQTYKTNARVTLRSCLTHHVSLLSSQLYHSDTKISTKGIELLNLVKCEKTLDISTMHGLCQSVAEFVFLVLQSQDLSFKISTIRQCQEYLQSLSQKANTKLVVLRALLENALKKHNTCLFYNANPAKFNKFRPKIKPSLSLCKENLRLSSSSSVLQGGSLSVFHAGVIGDGPRYGQTTTREVQTDQCELNSQMVFQIIGACLMEGEGGHAEKDKVVLKKTLGVKTARYLADLMVELVCPDVTYTSVLWPKEEHTRLTVERDLHIWKMFEQHPFLWSLLDIIAESRPTLCQCPVLLYGPMSSLMSFWDSSRVGSLSEAKVEVQSTAQIVHIMSKAGLLPSPLSHCHLLIPQLSATEVHLLLCTLWSFMKEHPPIADDFQEMEFGIQTKVFRGEPTEKASNVVHTIFQMNIQKFSHLYKTLFPEPT